jgi:hypothetical protein
MQRNAIYVNVSPEVKALVEKVADGFGLSMADFVRYVIKKELKSLGYLQGAAILEQPAPIKTGKGV